MVGTEIPYFSQICDAFFKSYIEKYLETQNLVIFLFLNTQNEIFLVTELDESSKFKVYVANIPYGLFGLESNSAVSLKSLSAMIANRIGMYKSKNAVLAVFIDIRGNYLHLIDCMKILTKIHDVQICVYFANNDQNILNAINFSYINRESVEFDDFISRIDCNSKLHDLFFSNDKLNFNISSTLLVHIFTNKQPFFLIDRNLWKIRLQLGNFSLSDSHILNQLPILTCSGSFFSKFYSIFEDFKSFQTISADASIQKAILKDKKNPSARKGHSLVRRYHDVFVLFGGREAHSDRLLNELWIFENASWEEIFFLGATPEPREFHSSWIYRDKFYVFGGLSTSQECLGDLWVFDLLFFKWKCVPLLPCIDSFRRYSCSSCCITFEKHKYAAVFGGFDKHNSGINELLLFPLIDGAFIPQNHTILPIRIDTKACLSFSTCYMLYLKENESEENRYILLVNKDTKCCVISFNNLLATEVSIVDNDSKNILQTFCVQNAILFDKKACCIINNLDVPFLREMLISINGKTLSVANVKDPSWKVSVFHSLSAYEWRALYAKRLPIVCKGLPLVECGFSITSLVDLVGEDHLISTHSSNEFKFNFLPRNYNFEVMPFKKYIDKICRKDKENFFYLRSIGENPRKEASDIFKSFPKLAASLRFPFDVIPELKEKHFSSVMRISSPNVHLWTHYDIMDNILFQISGEKTVTLWLPGDVDLLEIDGSSSSLIDYDKIEDPEHPFFRSTPTRFKLLPGEFLFIPSLVFHHIIAGDSGPSFAINTFWQHLPTDCYSKKDLYGNKDLAKACISMNKCQDAFTTIATDHDIPDYYKEFYFKKIKDMLTRYAESAPNMHIVAA